MELRELASFYQVARLRSVSKAARVLDLGQPTVTTHLQKLEEEFGITLFDRIRRPIQLTSEGATLLELVTPVMEAVGNLKTQMDYAESRGSFLFGSYPDLVRHYLPKSVQSFRGQFPDVCIRLLTQPYVPLVQLVKSGEIDLALCSPPPAEEPSLEFEPLFRYNVVLVTPPNHPLLALQSVELRDVAAWPLILQSPGSRTRQKLEQALKAQGITYDVVLAVDDAFALKRYVEVGLGVAVFNDFALHPEDHYRLGVVRMGHLFETSEIGFCTLKGKFLGRTVRNFMDTVAGQLRGFHPEVWFWEGAGDPSSYAATLGSTGA